MPTDLWYFYESDLNKGYLGPFLNSLPDHLRRMFKDSFGESQNWDWIGLMVLQGYRGPHTDGSSGDSAYLGDSNGLQEVRYWWGATKHLLWHPLAWVPFAVARELQDTDWHSLYFDSKTGECLSHNKNEACRKMNSIGHQLFREGKYTEAEEYHNNAYNACSAGYNYEQAFKNDRERAKEEAEAANLNSRGNTLFSEGKYNQAFGKYQEAYDKSQVSKEYNKYKSNKEKAQAEIDAINLNSEGDNLFNQGKYTQALSKYQEAYDKSQVSKEYNKYKSNKKKAQAEIDAINLNSEGDNLFNQGKYTQALSKYWEAHDKSQVSKEFYKYRCNKEKAQSEIDAMNLNSEGDNLFNQGKYTPALSKYQEAYDKSQVSKEYNKYKSNKEKAQAEIDARNLNTQVGNLFSNTYSLLKNGVEALRKYLVANDKSRVEEETMHATSKNNGKVLQNKLLILDTLWKTAWEAENDTVKDRSGEAKDLFHRVLSEAENSLKIYPRNLRLKQYGILASVKIDGDELFNEGLEVQQDGSKLLQEAQELKLQQKFESAHIKYKEAESKFSEAQEKFETGREKDQRFVSCIEFVQDQLNDVRQSIEAIEQRALRSRFFKLDVSINKNDCSEADFGQSDKTRDHDDYYSHI